MITMIHQNLTFMLLSGLPLPTSFARDVMSCIIYAQTIGRVKTEGCNDTGAEVFSIKCKGSPSSIAHLMQSLRRPTKPFREFVTFEDEPFSFDLLSSKVGEEDEGEVTSFTLSINYKGINEN